MTRASALVRSVVELGPQGEAEGEEKADAPGDHDHAATALTVRAICRRIDLMALR